MKNKILKNNFEDILRKSKFYEDIENLNEDEKKLVIKFKNKFINDLFFIINSIDVDEENEG